MDVHCCSARRQRRLVLANEDRLGKYILFFLIQVGDEVSSIVAKYYSFVLDVLGKTLASADIKEVSFSIFYKNV